MPLWQHFFAMKKEGFGIASFFSPSDQPYLWLRRLYLSKDPVCWIMCNVLPTFGICYKSQLVFLALVYTTNIVTVRAGEKSMCPMCRGNIILSKFRIALVASKVSSVIKETIWIQILFSFVYTHTHTHSAAACFRHTHTPTAPPHTYSSTTPHTHTHTHTQMGMWAQPFLRLKKLTGPVDQYVQRDRAP